MRAVNAHGKSKVFINFRNRIPHPLAGSDPYVNADRWIDLANNLHELAMHPSIDCCGACRCSFRFQLHDFPCLLPEPPAPASLTMGKVAGMRRRKWMVVLVGCRCRLRFLFRKSSHIVHRGFITVEESARRDVVSAGVVNLLSGKQC